MFKKIALTFRSIRRSGVYSIVNIAGLAISLATCVFIVLWVQDERSYDKFHKNADNIYMAITHFANNSGGTDSPVSTGMFATTAKETFGGVEDYCRVLQSNINNLTYEDVKTSLLSHFFADPNFFNFFNFPIVAGNRENPLQNPNDIVISERLATMLFANEDPIGKVATVGEGERQRIFNVTAVMKNMPHNTYLPNVNIDFVQSLEFITQQSEEFTKSWLNNSFLSFIRVIPGTNVSLIAEEVTKRLPPERSEFVTYSMQPLVNMHLYSLKGEPTGIKTVRMFQWIAIVILVIACINYVNLVTARASKRHREIGLKKMHGAGRLQLFSQLISEAAVMFVIAIIFALALNYSLLSFYNSMSGKEFELGLFDMNVWGVYLAMFLTVIILAGIYPAYMLASFKETNFAKSSKLKHGSNIFRKILVVTQFVASTVLIVGTIVLLLQMKYMREKDLGYHRDHVLMCNMIMMVREPDVVRNELEREPSILSTTVASGNIMNVTALFGFGNWTGKTIEGGSLHKFMRVDSSFVRIMGLKIIGGTNFPSTHKEEYILNEAAVKSMGITDDPVGKIINDNAETVIVGVVKDFNFESLHKEIEPLILYHTQGYRGSTLYIHVRPGNAQQAISALEKLWNKYNPDFDFDYWFLDDTFNTMYKSDMQTNKLFSTFAIIAILISCLGLFGLVVFTAELKVKEIGIRKVHGASIADIVTLMLRDFFILVGIAIFIAIPLSYYLLNNMLMDFAFRIPLSWWIFAMAGIITLILTQLTVSWMAVKAAMKNPLDSIMTD